MPSVPSVRVYDLPVIRDSRGSLSYAEYGKDLPFITKRYFVVFDVPAGEVRGGHAHKSVEQFLVCVKGSVWVTIDDGRQQIQILLEGPARGLYVPPLIWSTQHGHSPDAVLLVLSSETYDADEYIRSYEEFKNLAGTE